METKTKRIALAVAALVAAAVYLLVVVFGATLGADPAAIEAVSQGFGWLSAILQGFLVKSLLKDDNANGTPDILE